MTRQQKRNEIRALAKHIKRLQKAGLIKKKEPKKPLIQSLSGFIKKMKGTNGDSV